MITINMPTFEQLLERLDNEIARALDETTNHVSPNASTSITYWRSQIKTARSPLAAAYRLGSLRVSVATTVGIGNLSERLDSIAINFGIACDDTAKEWVRQGIVHQAAW
jgi:hypothetical protein